VVYGSDAIGGVMDFRTKEPLFSGNTKPFFKADALSRFSSADMEKLSISISMQEPEESHSLQV